MIAILGAGVSGITTATLLALLGYRTTIYTALRADAPAARMPEFASLYPAASIIPHSVSIADYAWHAAVSQRFFAALADAPQFGVRVQRHYEVFETPQSPPLYADAMADFALLPEDGRGVAGAPRRRGSAGSYGWHFRCYFAEMQRYLPSLYQLYLSLGGQIVEGALDRATIARLSMPVLVNCTGRWAVELFDDPRPWLCMRGVLVRVQAAGAALNRYTGEQFSYNYTPLPDVYCNADGSAADVYWYPRADGWLLGGTRQRGRPALGAPWDGEQAVGPTIRIGAHDLPAPVLELNRALLRDLTEIDIAPLPKDAVVGYRFLRDPDGAGARLEAVEEAGRQVVHNYGHGGAGVTFSWSCAARVAQLIAQQHAAPAPPDLWRLPTAMQPVARALREQAAGVDKMTR